MMFLYIVLIIFLGSYDWFAVVDGILMVIGMTKLLEKSGLNGKWAFAPCIRSYMLARCADRETEGRGLFLSELIIICTGLMIEFLPKGNLMLFTMLIGMVCRIIALIARIRIFSGLVQIYGVRRRWVIPWIFLTGPTCLYWGFSPKFQPLMKAPDIYDDSLSVISGTKAAEMKDGLTVNLEDRSVIEFFRRKYLLRDIHMYIRPGSMVLLLGGSGAGKTTLLNAINGYEKARAKVTLNGTDVYEHYSKMLYEVGFVPQQELMRGKDTVYRTLMDTALLRLPSDLTANDLKKRVEDVMTIFGLGPVRGNLVEKLSGGQKKRLSIAMELISNPSLFILDEPDSGLDGVMARELMEQLRKTADQNRIVIVITHTPDRVIDLFDDVIVLAKDSHRTGRLAFFGSIADARTFFGKEKMEEIVKSINRTEEGGEGKADYYIERFVEVQNG